MAEEFRPERVILAVVGVEERYEEMDAVAEAAAAVEDKENVSPDGDGVCQGNVDGAQVRVAQGGEEVAGARSMEVDGVVPRLLECVSDRQLVEMCRGALERMSPEFRYEFAGHMMVALGNEIPGLSSIIQVSFYIDVNIVNYLNVVVFLNRGTL